MNKPRNRGLSPLILLAVLLTACSNPADQPVDTEQPGKTYTVSFKTNDGTDSTLHTKTVTAPATTIRAANFPAAPSRTGYKFVEWNTQADGSGAAFTRTSKVRDDMTVYATWTAIDYTITYNLDDGTNTGGSLGSYTVEDSVTLYEPTRAGYAFGGWYDNSELSGSPVTSIPPGSKKNKTFYAKWNPGASVQIALELQPGDLSLSDTSIFVDEPAHFSAAGTGYTSWLWYWDGTLIGGENSATYTLAANSRPAGVYELSVVVTADGGAQLSAQCWVTVKAK